MVRRKARPIANVPELSRTGVAFLLLLAGFVDRGLALDPGQPFNSYIHTHFGYEEGLPHVIVNDIVQSQDGFLWLSVGGNILARFDGRHFTSFPYPRAHVLAIAPDGGLWVAGLDGGLEEIPAAALNQFGRLQATSYHPGPGPGSSIGCLHFSRSGVLWVGTTGGLYRFERGGFLPVIPRLGIYRIEEASNGHLLVITSEGFVEWDGSRAVPHPEVAKQLGVRTDEVFHVLEDSNGVTWFCTTQGVARRIGGSIEKLPPYGPKGHGAFRTYEDPRGNVWIAKTEGLFRATATGLELAVPGMIVRYMCGDRDGDLWIGTNGDGLFRFKDRAIRLFTTADGLPNKVIMTVLASREGGLWTGANCGGLSRFDGRRFQTYSEKDGLLNSCVWALAEDANRDLWIGTYGGGVFRFRDGRFTQYSKAQGLASDIVTGIVPARDGSLWIATPEAVSRVRDGHVRNYTTADGLSSNHATSLYEDRSGAIWAGTGKGIDRLAGDRFVNVSSLPNLGAVPIGEDRSGRLYIRVANVRGIFRIENNRPISVTPDIWGNNIVETGQGDVWLSGGSIYRFPPGGLQGLRGHDEPLDHATFGSHADGMADTNWVCSIGQPNSALTRDGTLWVATSEGLAMLDLPHLPRTNRKPAIYIEEVAVGRNIQPPGHELVLPPGTHHVELHFDAIELSSPEKILLQYRLDSVDSEWLDTRDPAHAVYSNIPPGTHAFHVRACNRDGIWDRAGMVYSITQQPYFYQTAPFQLASATAGCFFLFGLYRLRLRQATDRLNARLGERMAERERIARELHDTLLQGFQGLVLHFQAALDQIPYQEPAHQTMKKALSHADQVLIEGRGRVRDLRADGAQANELSQELACYGEELAKGRAIAFKVTLVGAPQSLHPVVREEIYRIAREALANAFQHSGGSSIEVEIAYNPASFYLRVRDNGSGIDREILNGGRKGHWGLSGMRERAQNIGGQLSIWSHPGAGTEIDLKVPAKVAYARGSKRSPWNWIKRGASGVR